MPSGPSPQDARRSPGLFHLVALGASAGAAVGAWWAGREVDLQRYVEVGFEHSAASLASATLLAGMQIGLLVGLVLALFGLAVRLLLGDELLPIRPATMRAVAARAIDDPAPLILPLVAGLAGLALLAFVEGGLARDQVLTVALGIAVWAWLAAVDGLRGTGRRLGRPALHVLGAALTVAAVLFQSGRRELYDNLGLSMLAADLIAVACLAAAAAWALLRALGSTGRRRGALALVALGWIPAISGGGALALASRAPRGVSVARPLNVVVIGIDTLRFDHTALADAVAGGRDLTPNLARLAERGTVFANAISQAPWTMPSFASIFTGRYPHEHAAISKTGMLRKSEVTLSEVLREAGYSTASIVGHYFVNNTHGFGQGYDLFDRDMVLGEWEITSEGISDRAVRYLDGVGEQPFFLFLHYFDPHNDYRDHAESEFADWYEGWLADEMHIQNLRHKRHLFGEEEVRYLVDLYDEEIVHTDREIGRVLDHLEARGLLEDTLIVVVADHGEEFMERGWIGHSITLSEEVIRVPLLVVVPGLEDRQPRVEDAVETRSVFATVLDALECGHAGSWPQDSLLPHMRGRPRPPGDLPWPNVAFSNVWTPDAPAETGLGARLVALRTDRWKLIHDYARDESRLYDLQSDPHETTDLSGSEPERLAEMRAVLDAWLEEMLGGMGAIPQRGAVEGIMRERLHALGYM